MFYCREIGPSGKSYPCVYDENPIGSHRIDTPRGVIKESIKEIPKEYEELPLIKLSELMDNADSAPFQGYPGESIS